MASSTWTSVGGANFPNASLFNNMLLLTDGSVLIQDVNTVNWYRLTPDPSSGTYEKGSWAGPFSMAIPRLYYASGVLQDGRVFVVGGELDGASQGGFMTAGEIFDPATNLWSTLAKPSNFDYINGDATSCVLADGRVIFGATGATSINNKTGTLPVGTGNRTAIWDPLAETWFEAGLGFASTQTKIGNCDEETWTLLPDGTVLATNAYILSLAEIYNPITDTWQQITPGPNPSLGEISIPNPAPNSTVSPNSTEIGPALVLPNGTVFALGGNGETGVYILTTTSAPTATWKPGPTLPTAGTVYNNTGTTNYQTILDGPACLLPSGQVLFVGGDTIYNAPGPLQPAPGYWSQSNFYIYDSTQVDITKQISPLDKPPNTNALYSYEVVFLLLPTGQVLCSTSTNNLQVLTPGSQYGAPSNSWRPVPTNIPADMVTGHIYTISGYLLNGLSQGSSYGDDVQNGTNYPIVQITSSSTPSNTRYLQTFDFSTRGISRVGDITPQSFSVQVPYDIPPGTWELKVIANGIGSSPTSVQIATSGLIIVSNSDTFSQGQIQSLENNSNNGTATIDPVLCVIVEGLTASDLNLTTGNLSNPPQHPTFSFPASPVGGITISISPIVPVQPEDPSVNPIEIQRFTFWYRIEFSGMNMFSGWPTANQSSHQLPVPISCTLAGTSLSALGSIFLTLNPNPFILHGYDITRGGPAFPWWLSVDIRVFQILAGSTKLGGVAPCGSNMDTSISQTSAITWIQGAINALNKNIGTSVSDFQGLPQNEDTSQLNLAATDTATNLPVYNFALARVRLQDQTGATANNVRVFFRMFPGARMDATYDPSTLYKVANTGTQTIPVLGVVGDEITTIPFFAHARAATSTTESMASQIDPLNSNNITSVASGQEIDAYYGAWLDINLDTQNYPDQALFPTALINVTGATGTDWMNGPFTGMGPLVSVQQLIRSQHQCLIAEINYDMDPIVANSDPSNSDKLAQRNLSIIGVPNPGLEPSRVAPQVFEIRPTPRTLAAANQYDELLIDWGGVPSGGMANIYSPGITAAKVLALAARMYATHNLTSADANTISCPAEGLTYIPIPTSSKPQNFAALLTVELPLGIVAGQSFTIIVKQITAAAFTYTPPKEITKPQVAVPSNVEKTIDVTKPASGTAKSLAVVKRGPVTINWRRMLGSFALTIPVSNKSALLPDQERLLSILLYIQLSIPLTSRWYPVFARYISAVAGRVGSMGGDPGCILPDPDGNGRVGKDPCEVDICGKVVRLGFDCGGRFEGFSFCDDKGREYWLCGKERELEELVQKCCRERLAVTITVLKKDRCKLRGIKVDERVGKRWAGAFCACGHHESEDDCGCHAGNSKHAHKHGNGCGGKQGDCKHEKGCSWGEEEHC